MPLAFSTGTVGKIPCPRFAMYLSFPKPSTISFAKRSILGWVQIAKMDQSFLVK